MPISIYPLANGKTVSDVANAVWSYLARGEYMDTRVFRVENGEHIVQACSNCGFFGRVFGMDRAINVRISAPGNGFVIVDTGNGKWTDKYVLACVAIAIWPLIIPAVIAWRRQGRLPKGVQRAAAECLGIK